MVVNHRNLVEVIYFYRVYLLSWSIGQLKTKRFYFLFHLISLNLPGLFIKILSKSHFKNDLLRFFK